VRLAYRDASAGRADTDADMGVIRICSGNCQRKSGGGHKSNGQFHVSSSSSARCSRQFGFGVGVPDKIRPRHGTICSIGFATHLQGESNANEIAIDRHCRDAVLRDPLRCRHGQH
jgi:hypothetical protein